MEEKLKKTYGGFALLQVKHVGGSTKASPWSWPTLASSTSSASSNSFADSTVVALDGESLSSDEALVDPSPLAVENTGPGWRATVVFRQCGFPVTLATAFSPSSADEARELAYEQAMSSGVQFINPSMAKDEVYDALRNFSASQSVSIRFSLSQQPQSQSQRPTCTVYSKYDWSMANEDATLMLSTSGDDLNKALTTAFYKAREELKRHEGRSDEMEELSVALAAEGKIVTEKLRKTDLATGNQNYVATVEVTDEFGNAYNFTSVPFPTAATAFRACAQLVYKYEQDAMNPCLLARLRWQVDGMVDQVFRRSPTDQDVDVALDVQRKGNGIVNCALFHKEFELARVSGKGRYLQELNAYALALDRLINKYPRIAQTFEFATHRKLTDEYNLCKNFQALEYLKGNAKFLSTALVLGACFNHILGQPYGQKYERVDEGTGGPRDIWHVLTITMVDPVYGHTVEIGKARSGKRTLAMRFVGRDVLEHNFPVQHDEIKDNAMVDMPPDPAPETGFETLPRKKQIEKAGTFITMMQVLGRLDYKWGELALETENDGERAMWRATVRMKNTKTGQWSDVVSSPLRQSKKDAKKHALIRCGQKYFPKDIQIYLDSHGEAADISQKDVEALENAKRGFDGTDESYMICKLESLFGRHDPVIEVELGDLGVAITVKRRDDSVVIARAAGAALYAVWEDLMKQAENVAEVEFESIEKLRHDYLGFTPKVARGADYGQYLATSFFGTENIRVELTGNEQRRCKLSAIYTSPSSNKKENPSTKPPAAVGGGEFVPGPGEQILESVYVPNKKEGIRILWTTLACKHFRGLLEHHSRHSMELQMLADSLLADAPSLLPTRNVGRVLSPVNAANNFNSPQAKPARLVPQPASSAKAFAAPPFPGLSTGGTSEPSPTTTSTMAPPPPPAFSPFPSPPSDFQINDFTPPPPPPQRSTAPPATATISSHAALEPSSTTALSSSSAPATHRCGEQSMPPILHRLRQLVEEEEEGFSVDVELSTTETGALRCTVNRVSKVPGAKPQTLGRGEGTSQTAATRRAAVNAMSNLFPDELEEFTRQA